MQWCRFGRSAFVIADLARIRAFDASALNFCPEACYWHVFTVRAEGGSPATPVQVTNGEWHHFAPGWSPDDAHITCISTRRDDWDTEWVWDVFVLDAHDGAAPPRCLTQSQGTCAAPAWSPDGKWIAYYANECPSTAYTQGYYLWLVPAAGGTPRNVSRRLDRGCQVSQPPSTNEPPHWSADSGTVFCHVREGGFYHYYAYDLAADQLHPVLASSDVEEPIDGWVRQSVDGGLLTFTAATAVRPAELYRANHGRLTDLNGDALASFNVRAPPFGGAGSCRSGSARCVRWQLWRVHDKSGIESHEPVCRRRIVRYHLRAGHLVPADRSLGIRGLG